MGEGKIVDSEKGLATKNAENTKGAQQPKGARGKK
jgi:hypothetical protein